MSLRLFAILILVAGPAVAADPVTVVLKDRAACGGAVVTVGDVGTLTGPANWKAAIAAVDLTDMPAKETFVTVTRRQVELRLRLIGLKASDFRVIGPDRVTVIADRKPVPVEDVVIAAKAAVLSRLPYPAKEVVLDLAQPVAVKLPEVGAAEAVDIKAEPNSNVVQMGRQQVNVTIRVRGEQRLSLAIHLNARRVGEPAEAPAARTVPGTPMPVAQTPPANAPVLVRIGQRVRITTSIGEIRVSAAGESQQEGKLGQMIRVRNVDSNKVVSGRVIGPGTVEVE